MSQKAIFLDRDDTVVDDPGYISEPEQIKLLPGAAEALAQFKRMGYLLIIITNQSAIARGYLTEPKLEKIHQRLKSLLATRGVTIDRLYYCPFHPDGTVEGFNKESHLRKPRPGMLQQAADELDIDLSRSWMIGDRYRDIEAGKAAGCHTIMVDVPGKSRELTATGPEPDRKAVNLREAVNIIRMYEFHQKAQAAKNSSTAATAAPKQPDPTDTIEQTKPVVEETNESEQAAKPENTATQVQVKEPGAVTTQPEPAKSPPVKFHTTRPVPKHDDTQQADHAENTHHLLQEILQRLKSSSRTELYDDFSIHKLLAGMAQVLALACIVCSLVLWLSPKAGNESVLIMVGYAIALQLLVVSLLMMHRRD